MQTSNTHLSNQPGIAVITSTRFGPLPIRESEKDELYLQILARKKEFVTTVPPANISQELEYIKIEFIVPDISREDCTIGQIREILWIKIIKLNKSSNKEEVFHWTFVLPGNLQIKQSTAYYGPDGRLVIIIPKN